MPQPYVWYLEGRQALLMGVWRECTGTQEAALPEPGTERPHTSPPQGSEGAE